MLARFLPRGAGGLAAIQPLAKAVVVGPVGAEWEAEVSREVVPIAAPPYEQRVDNGQRTC